MWGLAKMKIVENTILLTLAFLITSTKHLDEDNNFKYLGIL